MSASTRRVDVIGGGISGLASAYYLARSGEPLEIHVWEREPELGGLAGCFSTAHYTMEKFYHHLFRRDVAVQELLAEVGLGDAVRWRPASTGSYYQQQPYRLSSPLDLLRYRPLRPLDRLRLAWLMLDAKRRRDWTSLDDVTVRDYVTRVAGESVYRSVWEPLFRGKFGAHADRVSAAWLWSKLVDRGGSRSGSGRELLGYVQGGYGRLFRALEARLREAGHAVHRGAAVTGLEAGSGGRIARVVTDRGSHSTDCVVSGVQVPDLAALLPDDLAAYRDALRRIRFLGNVCLVLTLRRSLSSFYWTNITDPSFPFVGIVEQTRWADSEDFDGRHVAYVTAYVPSDDPRFGMDAKELLAFYLPYVQKMFPDFRGSDVEACHAWRAEYAQPVVEVGYRHRIPDVRTPAGNLFVCTMAQIYPHDRQVSNGVEKAREVADEVLRHLREVR